MLHVSENTKNSGIVVPGLRDQRRKQKKKLKYGDE